MFDSIDFEDKGCLACVGLILLVIALVVGCFFLEAWVVMLLWNAVMPTLFALPSIGFWMACCILMLCNLLFKSTHTIHKKKD